MSVLDLLRGARPGAGGPVGPGGPVDDVEADDALVVVVRHPWWDPARGAALGLATGLLSALLVVGPTLLGWATEARSSAPASEAVGVGAAFWLLASGARLVVGGVTVGVVPLLLWAGLVVVAAGGLARAVPVDPGGPHWRGLFRRAAGSALLAWWGGYAVVVAAAAGLTLPGPVGVVWWSLAGPLVLVPLLAAVLALGRRARRDSGILGPRLRAQAVLPRALRAAVVPALAGAGLLLAAGCLLVLGAVGLRAGQVAELGDATGAEGVGAVLLALAQAAALPNLGLWAVSWLAGPGYAVLDGASTTWSGAAGGELPLVPVLAALPPPGEFPGWVPVVVLVPVAVGAWVAHRALRRVTALVPPRAKLAVALWAVGLSALLVGLLDALAGGPLGAYRLASVGAPAPWLALALAAEMAVGAVAVVMLDGWRQRR
ncbi:MAG TPA: DUF6350 family protein [Dermatophilaceae bacterium]|nr:DUF6350 family protein [Dermatophilaceae bacterium]